MKPGISEAKKKLYTKQHYGLAGEHSAVKICGWTKKSLHNQGVCYKERFYGITCHRCMQCTPVLDWCTENCKFCWRLGSYKNPDLEGWEEPKQIADQMIEAQRKLLTGFKGDDKTDMRKWEEAQTPSQVAISLAGEPTIYPKLGELIKEFHSRGMTTFLVTNGTFPEHLESMSALPTQLYVTVAAPNKELLNEICRPNIPDAWEKLNQTLELMPELKTRKVIRLTLVKGLNMANVKDYADLIRKGNPQMVECKAYMALGSSRKRLGLEAMPRHHEIRDFSEKLAKELGWKVVDEQPASRVTLLAKENYDWIRDATKNPYKL